MVEQGQVPNVPKNLVELVRTVSHADILQQVVVQSAHVAFRMSPTTPAPFASNGVMRHIVNLAIIVGSGLC